MAGSSKTVVAIGKFDGVHIGHQRLLKKASQISKENSLISVALVIESPGRRLVSSHSRTELIKNCNIDKVIIQNLTDDFMNMSAEDFVEDYLCNKLNSGHVVVGYNFRFAKGRSATADDLKRLCAQKGIGCTVVCEVSVLSDKNTITASSSKIREFLISGDVESARAILGRNYSLTGKVVYGRQIGRTINIPTANLDVSRDIVFPKGGVYAAKVKIFGKDYNAITNIGSNPTVNSNGNITVETHIIDFEGDIYGKEITVEFIKKIRDEKKFDSLDELKNRIQKDIESLLTK